MSNLPQQPARRSTLSRRGVLKGGGVVAFAGLSLAALKLPSSGSTCRAGPLTCKATDVSSSDASLIISNWTGYIDPPNPNGLDDAPVQDADRDRVTYNVDINDNAEFYAKVKNQLGECEPIDRDMIDLTDWMAARMIGLGWVQPLDANAVPNLHANLIESLQGSAVGPRPRVPRALAGGLTGIAYNAAKVDEVGSFEDLITRPDLKGKITLLSEMPDTMGFMLKVTGADPEDFDDDDWDNAIDRLTQVIEDGQVLQFSGNNYLQQLAQGNLVRLRGLVGRRDPGAVRQPGHQVRRTGGGPQPLERQHDDPQQGRSTRPTPRRGSTTSTGPTSPRSSPPGSTTSVRSRAPGRRCEKIDPVAGREPADLPRRSDAREHVRLHDARRPAATAVRRRLVGCHNRLRPPRRPRPMRRTTDCGCAAAHARGSAASPPSQDLDLDMPRGSFFALLGPSGCGKTTTLRMVAGLEAPTSGTITLAGQDITDTKPYRRPVNTVFQNYALFPHLDIYENVAFGLRRRKSKRRRASRSTRCWPWSSSRRSGARSRPSSPAASSSGSRWPGPSSTSPRCSCSTSRSARSTSSCGARCRSSSSGSRPRWASRSCTSPTTRRRP